MEPRPRSLLDYREYPVLYVDDEPENLRIFELGFRREFAIVTATSGEGGPVRSTLFYNLYLYQNAFKYFDMGTASAMAWILLLIVLALTALVFRSSDVWVYYEGELKGRN